MAYSGKRHGFSGGFNIATASLDSVLEEVQAKSSPVRKRWQMRQLLVERDGTVCVECGEEMQPGDMSIDHVIPKSKGGTDHPVNLRLLHWDCNVAKGDALPPRGLRYLIREVTSRELWRRGWQKLGLELKGDSPLRV